MRKFLIIASVTCVSVAVLLWLYSLHSNKTKPSNMLNSAVPVQTAHARIGDLPVVLEGLGTMTARKTITIVPRVSSLLEYVAFKEGQVVHENQVLDELDPRPFQVVVDQWIGQRKHDQALLDDAKLDLQRYQGLLAKNSVSGQQVDTQLALVHQYQGSVLTDQAQLANARLQLSFCHVTAPFTGRVGLRLVDAGNMVNAGTTVGLVVITQIQPIDVIFPISEDNLGTVEQALRSNPTLPVEAYDRSDSTLLASGQMLATDNVIDPTTGTVKLKATFTNQDNTLFPDQFVNIHLQLPTLHHQTLIPSSAIQTGAQGLYVFVVNAQHIVHMRLVQVGSTSGEISAISQGLMPDERVVIDGIDRLHDGSLVSFKNANRSTPNLHAQP